MGTLLRRTYRVLGGRELRLAAKSARQRISGTSVINPGGRRLWFDPSDMRGRKLFAASGQLDVDAIRLWNRLADELSPDVVVDVGANYGEVALARPFPADTPIHLIEANPQVSKYLRRTVVGLPSVHLHEGAASDRNGLIELHHHSPFGVPYSGTASVEPSGSGSEDASTTTVPAFRLDQRIQLQFGQRLLFKIDVEGHEIAVLRGMTGLLEDREWAGMCEISHLSAEQLQLVRAMYRVSFVDRSTLEFKDGPGADDMKDVALHPKDH